MQVRRAGSGDPSHPSTALISQTKIDELRHWLIRREWQIFDVGAGLLRAAHRQEFEDQCFRERIPDAVWQGDRETTQAYFGSCGYVPKETKRLQTLSRRVHPKGSAFC